ncbi:hypothetical protein BGZ70_008653 [Mortierella alpina]|uniref:Uncharacterized protein n=1 Tax=Mortierella alpina TaxID=64518 RepID=A0A9P6JD38_MORAP|nr:hypothetical protein BGZ70_008653 [Mortierella alpina]
MAFYKVEGKSVEFLQEVDESQAHTRLEHSPGKVIEVVLCDMATPNTLQEFLKSRPSSKRSAPVMAVTTGQIPESTHPTIVVPSPEEDEGPIHQSQGEPHIAMSSYFPFQERQEILEDDEEDKHRHIVVQDPSQREKIDEKLLREALNTEKMIKLGPFVDMVTNYVQNKIDVKSTQGSVKDSPCISGSFGELTGTELRSLGTFLHKKDQDRVPGNLWRVVTPEGRVKWVCKHHFDEIHSHDATQTFLRLVTANNAGFFQESLRHLTLSFKGSKTAISIVGALAGAPSISELNLTLDWSFTSEELDAVVTKFNRTSVQLLTLDLKDKGGFFKRPRGRLLASSKYQSLQKLYRNPLLRSLRLFGASRFGTRTTRLLGDMVPNLQTLHFRFRFDCHEDQRVLQSIIERCPQLVDLQLGGTYKSQIHDPLAEAIGGLKRLEIFHLYGMEESREGGIICNLLDRLLKSGCPLRELVLVNSQVDAIETMKLIQSCEKTLEVLVLDLAVFQPLKLTSIFPHHCGCSLDSYQLLRNLTSLHFHVADETQSVQQLATAIEGLSLAHLGLSQRDPQAVKKSLAGKSLLQYVNFRPLRSLFLSGFSGECLDPLWKSAKELEFPASAYRPLESLSLEFLSNCPDLATKLNRLTLKSLWVMAEVEELGCEINQLALDLNLSTLKNVVLFRVKYTSSWITSSMTDGNPSSYFENFEQHLKSGKAQDLTIRVGEMIGRSDRSDLNGLSGLVYYVDEQRRITQGADKHWKHHNPRAEEVIEVRSTDDGDHYCHVRDIQHALEFDTLATYKVDDVNIEFLEDSDGKPGTTRLEHFPEKVIVVTVCEIEEPPILEVLRRTPSPSYHSVAAAQGSQHAATKGDDVAQEEPHRMVQEQRKGSSGAFQRYDEQVKAVQVELPSVKSKVRDFWLPEHELSEYLIPRLFVILPESEFLEGDSDTPKGLSRDKFRLHFICEGGYPCQLNTDGTTVGSRDPVDHAHMVPHEGYELLQPDEFLDKFGWYALTVLRFMKECEATGDTVTGLGSNQKDFSNMITPGRTLDRAINYLESKLNTKKTLNVGTDGDSAPNRFHPLSGDELRQLETCLRTKDHEVFGNLLTVITPKRRIQWVCMHHFDEAYLPKAIQDYRQLVTTTKSGFFGLNLRHLTLSLRDFKLATKIMGDLPTFPLMSELSLELDWDFNTTELDWIVRRLNESSVVHLKLDLKDKTFFNPPKLRLLSVRKYQSLQQLYQNPRLQSFRLVGASRFGIRTLRLTGPSESNLRTLHFRIRFDCKEDQEVLQSIIRKCPRLVDLQLGSIYKSEIHDLLAEAIGGLKKLEVLHLYGMEKNRSGGVISNLLSRLQESGCALRELVLVNSKMHEKEIMNLIKSCEKTLEVLVLDLADFQPLKLASILLDLRGPALEDYPLLQNLTSLHLHVSDELQDVRLLSRTLARLSLTHLGLSQQNPQGIKNSLEGKSLLHFEPKSIAADVYRPLESLSLECLSDCPDLASKINRLGLKSLWVIAEVDKLKCEVNQLARALNLSTLRNVALFRTKRTTYWYGSTLTERPISKLDVGKYYGGLEKQILSGAHQDLTLRVGEVIAYNNKLDLSIISVLTYSGQHAQEQTRMVPRAGYSLALRGRGSLKGVTQGMFDDRRGAP